MTVGLSDGPKLDETHPIGAEWKSGLLRDRQSSHDHFRRYNAKGHSHDGLSGCDVSISSEPQRLHQLGSESLLHTAVDRPGVVLIPQPRPTLSSIMRSEDISRPGVQTVQASMRFSLNYRLSTCAFSCLFLKRHEYSTLTTCLIFAKSPQPAHVSAPKILNPPV